MDWYVLFVVTGKEEFATKWLQILFPESNLKTLIPKRKLIERRQGNTYHIIKKMFPGYVLVNTAMDLEVFNTLKKIPDLIRILNTGNYYTSIASEEIAWIQRLMGEGDVVDYSKVVLINSRVEVKSGPLEGMEGFIKAVDKRKLRVTIEVQFLGKTREIDVGIEMLEK